jgi:hypothetical protein
VSLPTFQWLPLTWDAVATFLVGIAAVYAAWKVGENQIEIQQRQTRLIENDLKIQLLEKRAACIDEMRQISDAWFRNADLSNEEWSRFLTLHDKAQLLFSPAVTKKLDEASTAIFHSKRNHSRSREYYKRSKGDKAEEFLEKAFAAENKAMEIMPTLLDELIRHTRIDARE